jgi:hypothetical protein
MSSRSGQGAKARHVLALASQITVAVVRLLLWPVALVRPAPASRPVGIKARQAFAVRFCVPRGQRAFLMLRHHGTWHRFGTCPLCPGLCAPRAGRVCLALASKSARRLSTRAMRGPCSVIRFSPPPLMSRKLRPAAPLRGNPRALGFLFPAGRLTGFLAPLSLQKNLGLGSFAPAPAKMVPRA